MWGGDVFRADEVPTTRHYSRLLASRDASSGGQTKREPRRDGHSRGVGPVGATRDVVGAGGAGGVVGSRSRRVVGGIPSLSVADDGR